MSTSEEIAEIESTDDYNNDKLKRLTELMSEVLSIINPKANDNKTLQKTPERFSKALLEFVEGYDANIDKLLNDAIFDADGYDDIVIIRNIEFTSLCEHHMLPFFGNCTVGYYPRGSILGLSKFPRLVKTLAKKMHVQEKLTKEIAETLQEYINPEGVAVFISACHTCMCFRGVKSFNSETDTIYTTGCLKEEKHLNKFLSLLSINKSKN
jgi:GTP cyclohydrolase I